MFTTIGTITYTATGKGNYAETFVKTFEITPTQIAEDTIAVTFPSCDGTESTYSGVIQYFYYTGFNIEPEYTLFSSSLNRNLVLDEDYKFVSWYNNINVGVATLKLLGIGDTYDGEFTVNFTIKPRDVSLVTYTYNAANHVFTGSQIAPEVSAKLVTASGEKVVSLSQDVSVEYGENINVGNNGGKDAGTITITAKENGNYTGTTTLTFDILPRSIAEAKESEISAQDYTGSEIKPNFTLTLKTEGYDDYLLTEGVDYAVSYTSNVSKGEATIGVRPLTTNYTGTKTINFTIAAMSIYNIVLSSNSVIYKNASYKDNITISVYDTKNNLISKVIDGKSQYSLIYQRLQADGSWSTMGGDAAGGVTGDGDWTNVGTIRVIATATEEGNYDNAGKMVDSLSGVAATLTITPRDISYATVNNFENYVYYTGTEIEQAKTLTYNGGTLQKGNDYSAVYSNNTNAGEASVVITGLGNYSGSKTMTFTIQPRNLSAYTNDDNKFVVFENFADSLFYAGEAVTQPDNLKIYFDVTGNGKKDYVIDASQYEIVYTNNTRVGTASVTFKFNTNYTGSVVKTFTIEKLDISSDVNFVVEFLKDESGEQITQYTYQGQQIQPKIVVKYKGITLTNGVDYTIGYGDNVNVGGGTVVVTGATNFMGTRTTDFTIIPRVMDTVTIAGIVNKPYTGSEITQTPTLSYVNEYGATIPLTLATYNAESKVYENGDYYVVYNNNINAGFATITFRGIGNYTDSDPVVSRRFEVTALDINSLTLNLSENFSKVYTGSAITLTTNDLIVKLGELVINQQANDVTNYTLTYVDNINAGVATVIVTGNQNVIGTKSRTFTITPKNLTNSDVVAGSGLNNVMEPTETVSKTYTRSAIQLTEGDFGYKYNGTTLVLGKDFETAYVNNTNVGTATITLTGKTNYTGSITMDFEIVKQTIAVSQLEYQTSWVYNGSAIEPTVTIRHSTVNEESRVLGTDEYTVTYANNTNVGNQATLTVTLNTNNYQLLNDAGEPVTSVTRTFSITERALTEVTLSGYNFVYTGSPIEPEVYVYIGSQDTPIDSSCYTISYRNTTSNVADDHTNVGVIEITVVGKSDAGYIGTLKVEYTIERRSLTESIISVAGIANKTYINADITIPESDLVVTYTRTDTTTWNLKIDKDYTVVYEDNKNAGTATIKITGIDNFKDEIQTTFVIERAVLTKELFSTAFINEEYTYSGMNIVPILTGAYRGDNLDLNSDYTVEHSNNLNVGTANYTITGIGNYQSVISGTFEIVPQVITQTDVDKITPTGIVSKVYTGEAITQMQSGVPTFTISFNNGTETRLLAYGVDYTVTYSNNINVSDRAEINITFINNYSGAVTLYFEITPYNLENLAESDAAQIPAQAYTGAALTPDTTIRFNGTTLTIAVDYEISYANNVAATLDGSYATATIKGKGNFTGTVVRNFTITPKAVTEAMLDASSVKEMTYSGSYVEQALVIKDGTRLLSLNKDYQVTYENNINAATSTDARAPKFTVIGIGNYTGQFSKTFTIAPKNLESNDGIILSPIPTQAYNGSIIKPVPSIRYIGAITMLLQENLDFTVVYPDNTPSVGEHQVVITGIRNFTGTLETTFTISNLSITNVTISQESFVFNNLKQVPDITVYANDKVLYAATDYTVKYLLNDTEVAAPTQAGVYTIVVTAKGNFGGELRVRYEIVKRTLDEDNFTFEIAPNGKPYTGSTVYLVDEDVAVYYGDVELVFGEDFTLSYPSNPIVVANYQVVVNGIGNYTGFVTKTFDITPIDITDVVLLETSVVYDYNNHIPDFTVYSGLLLVEDYTVEYLRNGSVTSDFASAGIIAVRVTGVNNFSGVITEEFEIIQKDVDTLDASSFTYYPEWDFTGAQITPSIAINYGVNNLIEYKDYEVIYGENVNIGENAGSITIKGMGNFKGETVLVFNINKVDVANATITLAPSAKVNFTGYQITPEIVVVFNGAELEKDKDYQVIYGDNIEAGENAGLVTVKALDGGNITGETIFRFTITPKLISSSDVSIEELADEVFTGRQISPLPTIKDSGRASDKQTLVYDTDYTVVYATNVNVGTGTFEVVGKGDYTGTISGSFNIVERTLNADDIQIIVDPVTYTGYQVTPDTNVKLVVTGDNAYEYSLVRGRDYEVSYGNNDSAGESAGRLTVYALDNGNFKESKTINFAISKKALDTAGIVVETLPDYTYTSSSIVPQVVIKYTTEGNEPIQLAQNIDFTLEYDTDNGNAPVGVGSYNVTIKGSNNYSGTISTTMRIVASAITSISLSQNEFTYNYLSQIPTITVGSSDTSEVPTYTTTYRRWIADNSAEGGYFETTTNTIDAGIIQIVVQGTANFSGTQTATYTIFPKNLSDSDIVIKYYTESANREYKNDMPALASNTEVKAEVRRYFDDEIGANISGVLSDSDGYYVILEETLSGEEVIDVLFTRDGTAVNTNWAQQGTVLVKVTAIENSNYTGSVNSSFNILPTPIDSVNTPLSVVFIDQDAEGGIYYYTGDEIEPSISVLDGSTPLIEGTHYNITRYISNIERGTATFVIEAIENSGYSGQKSWTFTIAPRPLSHFTITNTPIEAQTYTGFEIEPLVNLVFNGVALTDNDVSLAYTNNTNAGEGKVIFSGKGNYTGSKEVTFVINKKLLTGATDVVFDEIPQQKYTQGAEITPSFTVRYGNYVLTADDYDVQYLANDRKGDATIRIEGKGNFTGYTSTTFVIAEQPLSRIVLANNNVVFTGSSVRPANSDIVVYDADNKIVSDTTQYTLSYERAAYGTENYYPVSTNETWINAGHIRITASATVDGNYGGNPVSVVFTIIPQNITDQGVVISNFENVVTYAATPIIQNFELVYNGDYHLTDTDFTAVYENNTTVGTATITINASNNFVGSRVLQFNIERLDFATETTKLETTGFVASKAYTGSGIEQNIVVYHKLSDTQRIALTNDTDYEIVYANNVNAGTATMSLVFKGNYVGTVSEDYTITPRQLSDWLISTTLPQDSFTYTAEEIKPEVVIMNGENQLTLGLDYDVVYTNNIIAATASDALAPTVTIEGKGNYTGTITRNFAINPRLLSEVKVEGVENKVFTGEAITQELTLSFANSTQTVTLVEGENADADADFYVTYTNNTNVGVAYAIIQVTNSCNNYANPIEQLTISYSIMPFEISDATVGSKFTVTITNPTYTGSQVLLNTANEENLVIEIKNGESLVKVPYTTDNYELSYQNNINAGQATVTITGKGNLVGSYQTIFEILPKSLSDTANPVMMPVLADQTYTGSAITINFETNQIQYNAMTLIEGVDFDASYVDGANINVSEVEITLTGKGNYKDTTTLKFNIVPLNITEANKAQYIYVPNMLVTQDNSPREPTPIIKYNGMELVMGIHFTTVWMKNTGIGTNAEAIITFTDGGNYWANGSYSNNVVVTFAITPQKVNELLFTLGGGTSATAVYTGSSLETDVKAFDVRAEHGGPVLQQGTDYVVEYYRYQGTNTSQREVTTDFTSAGTILVVVEGINDYANNGDSKIETSFTITPRDLSNFETDTSLSHNLANKYAYTGSAITPEVIISINGTAIENTNYVVQYDNNIKTGIANVTVTGTANLIGSVVLNFEIGALTLTSDAFKALFTGLEATMTYTGDPVELPLKAVYSGYELKLGSDFEVEYEGDNINVTGSAVTATVKGMGGFVDCESFTTTFQIVQRKVANSNFEINGIENKQYTGSYLTQTYVAYVDGREVLEGIDYDLTYEDNIVRGTATMKFVFKNNYVNNENIVREFTITPKELTSDMIDSISAQAYTGSEIKPKPNVVYNGTILVEGIDFTYSWTNNIAITEIAVITVTAIEGNYTGYASKNFAISNNSISDSSDFEVDGVEKSYVFTGLAITPKPILTYVETGVELIENTDYTIAYVNNINVGEAIIQIQFIGSYDGYAELRFEITKADLGNADNNIEILPIEDQIYTGHPIQVMPIVTINGVALNYETDFTLEYVSNINVARDAEGNIISGATVTVIATESGNFSGFKDASFKILEADIANATINIVSEDGIFIYTGFPIRPMVEVMYGDVSLYEASHYTLQYTNNTNKGDSNSELKPTITVTAIEGGNFKGVQEVYFTIGSKTITESMISGIDQYEFTGLEITPRPVVYDADSDYTLVNGVDFELSYSNNISVGKGKISVKGIGNFEGEVVIEFNIIARVIGVDGKIGDKIILNEIAKQTYSGSAITPDLVVQYKESEESTITLVFGTDYIVRYINNINAGTATIRITGINNYTGYANYNFEIAKYSLNGEEISINEIGPQYYNYGAQIMPEIIITFKGEQLQQDVDYAVSYGANFAVGEDSGSIEIYAYSTSNFEGEIFINFDILALELKEFSISASEATYSAKPYTITYSATCDGRDLIVNTDYYVRITRGDVETTDFTSAGTITFTATGFGNYTGTVVREFVIYPKMISDIDITKNPFQTMTYNDGLEITQSIAVNWQGVMTLFPSRDYNVIYENNTDAGVALVTIVGIGNFAGEIRDTFIIMQKQSVITGAPYYEGNLYEGDLTQDLRLSVPAGSTRGYVRLLDEVLRIGEQEYFYEFIPTKENGEQDFNYTMLSGKTVLNVLKVELIGIELGDAEYQSEYTAYDYFNTEGVEIYNVYNNGKKELVAAENWSLKDKSIYLVRGVTEVIAQSSGYEVSIPVTVNAKEISIEFTNYENLFESRDEQYINYTITGDMEFEPASQYITLTYENLTTGRITSYISVGGTYKVYATLEEDINYVFVGETSIEFKVTSKSISAPAQGVEIFDDNGIDVESNLIVNKIIDDEHLMDIVGDLKIVPEAFYNIHIENKDGTTVTEIGHDVSIRFTVGDPTRTDYAVYRVNEDGSLTVLDAELVDGTNYIEFVTDKLGEFLLGSRLANEGNTQIQWWWIAIGVAAVVAAVAITMLIILKNRKRKMKFRASNNGEESAQQQAQPEMIQPNMQQGMQQNVQQPAQQPAQPKMQKRGQPNNPTNNNPQ